MGYKEGISRAATSLMNCVLFLVCRRDVPLPPPPNSFGLSIAFSTVVILTIVLQSRLNAEQLCTESGVHILRRIKPRDRWSASYWLAGKLLDV